MARIDALFDRLLELKGSDLHLGVDAPPMGRVRGSLMPLRDQPLTRQGLEELLFEIATEDQRHNIVSNWDLDFAYQYGDKARFRANYFYKQTGIAAVFRTIPSTILSLDELKTPDAVRKLSERRAGLVLVTGPTGSGKSTTLAGMINHINKTRAGHVLTIEDPIEFVHEPDRCQITHREVGQHASSFSHAIRSSGRENPDVILIGELRTNETMRLALQLASYGVLVFGTVHTNSAPATIERIINAFPADEQPQIRGMLADGLAGIVAQQLLKTADGKGRCAALEILLGSHAVSAIIRENKTFQLASLMQSGKALGMQTMDSALEKLVRDGKVNPQTALEKAEDKESFKKLFPQLAALKDEV
ncbi:MAG: PilT/PilU family type 4a pilus ATPase [Polyangiales bacterium]